MTYGWHRDCAPTDPSKCERQGSWTALALFSPIILGLAITFCISALVFRRYRLRRICVHPEQQHPGGGVGLQQRQNGELMHIPWAINADDYHSAQVVHEPGQFGSLPGDIPNAVPVQQPPPPVMASEHTSLCFVVGDGVHESEEAQALNP
eukprot:CAMPEP_0184322182 /NCGR_PEP_ID=MMETSP1049-20130417/123274_1 /TAXON_ID=77928 /ORGANISM="Proteomonas sulcata, Strain CCMP704" /LENGTH=149 /DNA_ID=CAMNT_0026643227 /DNA_START=148 /DNA_END=598 /DNA_ORIENTATION=+